MAKKAWTEEMNELIAKNELEVVENNKFEIDGKAVQVRSMENTRDPLEVGDVITIPEDYKVVLTTINGQKYPCTYAEVTSTDGSSRNMQFFPNSLAKVARPLDENGKPLPKVKTSGTVARWYQEKGTIDKAMEELKGKSFRVAKVNVYTERIYNSTDTRNVRIYQYEWA